MLHINALIDRYVLLRHALFINTLISLTAIDTRIDVLLFNPPINLSILPAYLPACLPTCLPIYLSTYLPVYLSTCPPTCLPARLPAYLPAYLSTCPPTYLPACLSACLSIRPVYSICLFDLPIQSAYSTYLLQ